MTLRLVLRWSGDHELLHRVQNMGEEVFRQLPSEGLGEVSINEVDASVDHFFVDVLGRKNLNRAKQALAGILQEHNLQRDVRIEPADG